MPLISWNTLMSQYKIAFGTLTTVTAADTIPTGLKTVVFAIAALQDDASAAVATVSAGAAPTPAGSIVVKTWAAAGTAAGTFGKKVTWVAFGL